MSGSDSGMDLARRVRELEARIGRLEQRLDDELPEIPWQVLAVAVAAVIPDGKIISAMPVPDPRSTPVMHQNLWCVGGRLDLFRAHRLR